jgi:hypothetical protein
MNLQRKNSIRYLLTGLLFVAVELEAEVLAPVPHGVQAAPTNDARPELSELLPPAGSLICPTAPFCEETKTPARCEMDACYRKTLQGGIEQVDRPIVVSADNYCLAARQICEQAAKRTPANLKDRPIYCLTTTYKAAPEPAAAEEAHPRKNGIYQGVVSVVTRQEADPELVKKALLSVKMLGDLDVVENRFSGNGVLIQEKVTIGDEADACRRALANEFLKKALQSCSPVAARDLNAGRGLD